jgi:hypothetical protein
MRALSQAVFYFASRANAFFLRVCAAPGRHGGADEAVEQARGCCDSRCEVALKHVFRKLPERSMSALDR